MKNGKVVLIDISLPSGSVKLAVSKEPWVQYAVAFVIVLYPSPVGLNIVILSTLNLLGGDKFLGGIWNILHSSAAPG